MSRFKIGDKVKIKTPEKWPAVTRFTLEDAEGTVDIWVDWPEAMDIYSEYAYVMISKASGDGKLYEGTHMIFHEDSLEKIAE